MCATLPSSAGDPNFGDVQLRMRGVRPSKRTVAREWSRAYAQSMWDVNRVRLSGRRSDGLNASTTAVMHMQVDAAVMQSADMDSVRHPVYSHTTPPEPFAWNDANVPGIMGFGIPPHATATLVVELLCRGCKFKILSIVSC